MQKISKEYLEKLDSDIRTAVKFFEDNNCVVLKPNKKNASGPDLNIIKNNSAYRVEVKKVRKQKRDNCWIVDPVTENRKNDDFVIVIANDKVIAFEEMRNYLKVCNNSGNRIFSAEMEIYK